MGSIGRALAGTALACGLALALAAHALAAGVTFKARSFPVAGSGLGSPTGLDVGDVDGDGDADVAVALHSGALSILLRDAATGTYSAAPGSPYALGSSDAGPLELADVDGDGDLDVVAFRGRAGGSSVAVLRGDGAGGFGAPAAVPLPGEYGSMAVADVDGDGDPDLVTPLETGAGPRLFALLGAGDGTFGAALGPGAPLDGAYPSAVAVADFDRDGKLDAAVAPVFVPDGLVTVLRGDGAGGFAVVPGGPADIGSATFSLAAGDVDGDGVPDLVSPVIPPSGDNRSATPGVLLGNGDGTLRAGPPGSFVTPPGLNPSGTLALALGDLDGDGRLDAALPVGEGAGLWSLFGDGTGRFLPAGPAPIPTASAQTAAKVVDVDGDARLDVLVTSIAAPARLIVLTNDAEPGIAAPAAVDLGSREVGAAPATATVTISNPGDHGLLVGALSVSGPAAAEFAATGCAGARIPAGGSCDATVAFAPAVAGARAATLQIASDAPGAATTAVALTATATAPPDRGGNGGRDGRDGGDGGRDGGDGGRDGGDGGRDGGDGGRDGGDGGRDGGDGGRDGGDGGPGGRSPPPAALRLTVRPARLAIAPGGRARVTLAVRNAGGRAAARIAVCPRRPARGLAAGRCLRIARLAPSRTARRTVTLALSRRARRGRTYAVTLAASARGARPATARVTVTARR